MTQETVMLIDDDVELTSLMSTFLQSNGFTVHVVHEGDQAEEQICSVNPDLIVLDLMLPGTDGLTICRQVRDDFSGPIIMLTALDDEIDEVTGPRTGG